MGFTAFEIKLDNSHQSYFAGQIVSGKIIIGLNRMKKVKGVKLKLIGKAKAHWKENRGKSSTTVSDVEYYIDEKVYLFGYEESNAEVFLPQGWNEYPFWFQLPQNIPSSFEMKHGYVKYALEVIISRESTFKFDHKLSKLFTVNALLDLNASGPPGLTSSTTGLLSDRTCSTSATATATPAAGTTPSAVNVWSARHEIELYNEKFICCCCCMSGPITFMLKIPKTGYVPGESISFYMELNNSSQRNINLITLSLAQYSTFYAKKKYKQVTNEVAAITGPVVLRGQTEVVWADSTLLTIPSVPPTNLGGGCNIITVEYFVKVEIDIPGGLSLKGKVPVIIGTIPLRSGQADDVSSGTGPNDELQRIIVDVPVMGAAIAPGNNWISSNRPTSSAPLHLAVHSDLANNSEFMAINQPLAGYPNLPPPTYEEAVFCYSAQQRREDGLDDAEQGDYDDESRPPPDYTKVTANNAAAATADAGSDEENEGGGDNRVASGVNNPAQTQSVNNRANNNFVPKYVTYKYLGLKSSK